MKRRAWIGFGLPLLALLAGSIWLSSGASPSRAARRLPPPNARLSPPDARLSPPDARLSPPSARSNARLAQRTARRLLEEVPLPDGASEVSSDESLLGNLKGPASSPQRTPQLVRAHRFWHVDEEPEAAISWMEAHPPAGSTIVTRGTGGETEPPAPRRLRGEALRNYLREHSVTTIWEATFAFEPSHERLATVWLAVSVAAAKGGGSEIRADALIVWRRPRPAAEHIPRAVGEVTVHVSDPRRDLHFSSSITSPKEIGAIVAVIEGLQRPEGGVSSCPADDGKAPVLVLAFRARKGTPTLVRVRIDENGCGSVSFARRGRELPALGEAYEAIKRLRRVLGREL